MPASHCVRVPDPLDLLAAGGVPEAFITAHDAMFTLAAATLRAMGYTRAVALDGGFKAWREAGHPMAEAITAVRQNVPTS